MIDDPAAMPEQNRWWSRFNDATAFWRAPVIAGVVTGVGAWLVWYFTKVPCIMENAAGLCNPGVLASYINLPTLASCLAIGGGFATFAGGYNIVMLNRERQRADEAEARLRFERERSDQERERYERLMDEFLEERRQSNEDRRQFAASQQAMMTTLAEISATLARLAEQQQNGHRASGD